MQVSYYQVLRMFSIFNCKSSQYPLVVSKLSLCFTEFMKALSYEGGIFLKDTDTIDRYEIVLMVSFRHMEPLMALSGQRHSGGERAVSTIMYLMALQGNFLMIHICNFHVLSNLLLIYICKLHWNQYDVSTIMHLMALQELACSPFRLIPSDLHMKFPCRKSFTIDFHT